MRVFDILPYIVATVGAIIFVNAIASESWSKSRVAAYKVVAGLFLTAALGLFWLSTGEKPDELMFKYVLCPVMPSAAKCKEAQAAVDVNRPNSAQGVIAGSGQSFRDNLSTGSICSFCPEMLIAPAG